MKKIYVVLLMLAGCLSAVKAQYVISTAAGNGTSASGGDGGPALSASFNSPHGVAFDAAGNMYVSEFGGNRIRKISTGNIVSTFAGNGTGNYSGDGGLATSATVNKPVGMCFDASGNMFFADYLNHCIRKITPSGIITTVAGTGGVSGFGGDGGLATSALLNSPCDVKVDAAGNLLIADSFNNRVRAVNTSGIIFTVVGNGTGSSTGDGGLSTSATVNFPAGVYLDASGNIYITELNGHRVRMINSSAIISTIFGNGTPSSTGDGGPATAATVNGPGTIIGDPSGNLLISEYYGQRIRSINPSGTVTTIAGTGVGSFSGDGGPATSATMNGPFQIALDASNNIYVGEYLNSRVRKLSACASVSVASITNSVNCFGNANGSATLIATGGSGFTYTWSPTGGNSATAFGLTAGNYTVTVKNSCGSTSFATINITQPPVLNAAAVSSSSVVCAGTAVNLIATAFGGVPAYTYSWSSGGNTSTTTVTVNTTSTYTFTVTDANVCSQTATVMVSTVPNPTVTAASSSSLICAGQTVTLTASGASTYTWNTTATTSAIAVSPSVTTSYTVTGSVTGCPTSSMVISQSVSPCTGITELTASAGINVYPNPSSGEFILKVDRMNSEMHFEIFNSLGQSVKKAGITESETHINIKDVAQGVYYLKLTTGNEKARYTRLIKE